MARLSGGYWHASGDNAGKAPIEERLRGLSLEEVLRTLPPEFVAGLSAEEAARLRELLERKQGR